MYKLHVATFLLYTIVVVMKFDELMREEAEEWGSKTKRIFFLLSHIKLIAVSMIANPKKKK